MLVPLLAIIACALFAAAPDAPSGMLISNRAITFNPTNGKVYAVDQTHGTVTIIQSATGSSQTVEVGAGPDAVAVNKLTGKVYVANSSGGTVSILDGATNSVTATLKAGPHPYVLAVNEVTNRVYVTNTYSDLLAVIDGATNTVRFLKLGSADNIVIDSHTNRIFLMGYEDPNIRILNGETETVTKAPAHEHLWGMAINESLDNLYLTGSGAADLLLLGHHPATIPVGKIPCAVASDTKSNILYVVNYGDSTVTVIDPQKQVANATVKVGAGPQAIAIDSNAGLVYVANTHANTVSVIDTRSNAVVATVPAGTNPYAITTGSTPGVAYVATLGQHSFAEVRAVTR